MATAELKAKISLDNSGFQAGIRKVQNDLSGLVSGITSQLGGVGGLFGVLGGAGLGATFAGLALSSVKFGDDIASLSVRLGVGTDELQKLSFAASQTNTSLETITGGIQKLSVNSMSAIDGSKELQKHFSSLGITVDDLKTKGIYDIFLLVADAVLKSTDPTRTMADVIGVMGKSAGELIPLLSEGSLGIKELGNEAYRTGAVIDAELIETMNRLDDRMKALGQSTKVLGANVALGLGNVWDTIRAAGAIVEEQIARAMGDVRGMELAQKKLRDIGAENLGIELDPEKAARKAKGKGQLAEFNRVPGETPEGNKAAAGIERLRDQIEAMKDRMAIIFLSPIEQIQKMTDRIAALRNSQAGARNETERLEKELQILQIEEKLGMLTKQQGDQKTGKETTSKKVAEDLLERPFVAASSLERIGAIMGGGAASRSVDFISRTATNTKSALPLLQQIAKNTAKMGGGAEAVYGT